MSSTTGLRRALKVTPPNVIAIVELDEGVRMMSNLVEVEPDLANLPPDMSLQVSYEDVFRSDRYAKVPPSVRIAPFLYLLGSTLPTPFYQRQV